MIRIRLLALASFISFISLADYSLVAFATPKPTLSEPVHMRLMVHDFNHRIERNNLGGNSEIWASDLDSSIIEVKKLATPSNRKGENESSLYMLHTFNGVASRAGLKTQLNGLDASDYDHLEFWVKGDANKGYAHSFKIQFQKPENENENENPQLTKQGSYVVTGITDQWQRIRVPLNVMTGINSWTNLKTFNIIFNSRRTKVKDGGYFIDDIALIKTGKPGPSALDKVVPIKKKLWEESWGGKEAAKPYIRNRLVGWPKKLVIDKAELPEENDRFLLRLARDTWRGLDSLSDRDHGLPLDTVKFTNESLDPEHSHIGDYTNITNVGLYLLAVVAAKELEFIDKQQALDRLDKTFSTLEHLETYQGFYYNYYDTTSLERTSNFISFVDSAWLTAGLMVVRMAFPEYSDRSTKLIERGHYKWLYDDVEQLMSHGYYTNLQYPAEYHYGLLYTESRMGSLIAIGKGDVPQEHWFKMARTLPTDFRWQSLKPKSQKTKSLKGVEFLGGYYEWNSLKFVPSWGGSLFEALMPTLVVDEKKYAPNSLGINNEIHAEIHRRYALDVLKYPVWGMSPSSTVLKDSYSEYGVKILGSRGYKGGVVSPHASALALNVTPDAAIANLRKIIELYDIYGEYGLYDAVDPISGKVARAYLALDQGMTFIAIANYLKHDSVQNYFMSDPIAVNGISIIGEEHFFD